MKKRRGLYALSSLLLLGGLVGVVSCGNDNPTPPDPVDPNPPVVKYVEDFSVTLSGNDTIVVGETVNVVATSLTEGVNGIFTYAVEGNAVSINDNGLVTGLSAGTATIKVTCVNMSPSLSEEQRTKTIQITCAGEIADATGAQNYVGSTYEEKLDILGRLEKYAIDNHLTGLTLFENGGYVMYSDRIEKPTNEYITGYGLGVLSEGRITSPMSAQAESNPDHRMYYHSYGGVQNKQNFNYLDDTGSESANLYGYISSTYYGQKLNATRDGYDWYPVLAKERPGTTEFMPEPLNTNPATGLATMYKVYVKTEKDGLVYNTLSTKPGRDKYKAGGSNHGVKLEDYVTSYMLLLNGKIGLARNADYISDSNNATLKGARAFSDMTKNADNGGDVEAMKEYFTRLVGLEKNEEEGSLTFTFNTPVNQFTAMSNLSSTLTSPIPLQFIKDLAAECGDTNPNTMYRTAMKDAYGTANSHNETYTPVDNTLSLSAYMLEDCQEGFNVYKRNPEWVEFKSTDPTINSRYSIEGIKILYLSGAQSDPNFAFNQFINVGNLDAISIPKDYMNQYVNDRRTTTTQGDSTFKLNLNTATQKEWDELFKATSGANPYTCKPLMSNDNFVNALSFAIDRQTYAQTRGSVASQSYFAPAYLWEPEKGLSYNDTPQHAAAIAEYSPETNGYDFDLAVQLMDQAIAEEINKGNYSGYNDSEKITINWMNTTDPQEYGIELTQYFAKAFAATNAAKRGFKLTFENIPGTTNYQDVYDIMEKGTFDMAFGSVSGMQLDPLGFMEVLKSDNSSGFTLNWGIDTSSMKEDYIIYDGMRWSFDGLWTAATKGAVIEDDGGVNKEPVKLSRPSSSITSGKVTVGDNTQVDAWSIIYQFQAEVNASGLSFKAFADAQKKEDEYVTVTLSYKVKGDQATHTAVFNANYGELFFFRDGDLDANGAFNYGATANKGARFQIYVPKVLDQNSTFNQIAGNPIDLTQCTELTMSIYATYYMEIDNIPVSTTLTSANVKVI